MTFPRTIDALEAFAKRYGWDERCGDFMDWITLRLVGCARFEKELEAAKAESTQFTRWWYATRMETMHRWMRENAPEKVKEAYFSIVANGSAEFSVPDNLRIKAESGKVAFSLLEEADKAVAEAQRMKQKGPE